MGSRLRGGPVGVLAGYQLRPSFNFRLEGGNGTHLSVEVECNGLVGNLHVGNLDDDLLELIVIPISKSLSHGESSVIGFIYQSAAAQFDGGGSLP